jgi:hypothetical protein
MHGLRGSDERLPRSLPAGWLAVVIAALHYLDMVDVGQLAPTPRVLSAVRTGAPEQPVANLATRTLPVGSIAWLLQKMPPGAGCGCHANAASRDKLPNGEIARQLTTFGGVEPDKAGQVLLALERERRRGVGRDGRTNRHRLPATGAEPVSSELTRKVNG